MNPATLKRWAERLCRVTSTSRAELEAAIEGADQSWPPGVTDLQVDDREVSLGGIWVRFEKGAIPRRDYQAVFGPGEIQVRLDPKHPVMIATTIEVPDAPHCCNVFAEYREDRPDESLQGIYLRVDRARRAASRSN
jgi:hypothetical protein